MAVAECRVGHSRRWVVNYGELWKEKLRENWNDAGKSLREIGRILGRDPLTIKRQAQKLNLPFPRAGQRETTTRGLKVASAKAEPDISRFRGEWLDARRRNPQLGGKALRNSYKALYAALYRHDREWLLQNMPQKGVRLSSENRVNWDKRDGILSAEIGRSAQRLRGESRKFGAVSKTAIMRDIDALSRFRKLEKLPLAAEALKVHSETREEFACRRIRIVVSSASAQGKPAREWKIKIDARIRPELAEKPNVKEQIQGSLQITGKR
jgi:hypothetical protein